MNIGIETISMDLPAQGLDLRDLAAARGVDFSKYQRGIGQEFMAVPAPDEDVVTLAANAALRALEGVDRSAIRTVIFATESGVDQSKAAAIYVHRLLDLPPNCRTVEMKQACCSSTSALHFALATVALHPEHKVLVLASDIARYGLGSAGEPTQGAGAVAMVVSANPRVLRIDPDVGYYTRDVMDFWRPNYRSEAIVDGKFSIKIYLEALEHSWREFQRITGARFGDFAHYCYHLPFTRMALKAHLHLAHIENAPHSATALQQQVEPSIAYNRVLGNAYTASLYIGLLSLLDEPDARLEGRRIGFFSYGSGCMGAFFSGTVLPGYRSTIPSAFHRRLIRERRRLTVAEYEHYYSYELPQDGNAHATPCVTTGSFRLAGIQNHQRIYEAVPQTRASAIDAAAVVAAAPRTE